MKSSLFMETTQISATKTAGEITQLLVEAGARQISLDYDDQRKLCGLRFVLIIGKMPLPFRLPARSKGVFEAIWKRGYDAAKFKHNFDTNDRRQSLSIHAERVVWRQLLRWTEAQLAMIQTGMAEAQEVFLPYMQRPDGKTVYELFSETQFKAIGPASNVGH